MARVKWPLACSNSRRPSAFEPRLTSLIGLGAAATEPDRPQGVFGELIGEGVGIFEGFGQTGDATT